MNSQTKELLKGRHSLHDHIYSITSCTYKRAPTFSDFYLARDLVRSIKKSDMDQATKTIGFVIMPDHFHWLFQLQDKYSLSDSVGRVKGRSALAVNRQRNSIHKVWQPGFYDRCLREEDDVADIMRYIVANPLRAGLVKSIRSYPHWDCIFL